MEDEYWNAIAGYEGYYEVSSEGRVRGIDRVIENPRKIGACFTKLRGRIMRPAANKNGYLQVSLTKSGKSRTLKIHVLVATAFIGPRPVGYDVCHNDGIKTNNRADNLRYDTRRANVADKAAHGTQVNLIGEAHGRAKLNEDAVRHIRANAHISGEKARMSRRFGVSDAVIHSVASGRSWKHVA